MGWPKPADLDPGYARVVHVERRPAPFAGCIQSSDAVQEGVHGGEHIENPSSACQQR